MKKINGKAMLLLAMVLIILIGAVSGTIAWITTNTEPVVNTFKPGEVGSQIKEEKDGTQKTSIQVKNTGNTDAYMRVSISGNWFDKEGNIVTKWSGSVSLNNGWTKTGDYYYYTSPVAPDASTKNMLAAPISGTALPDGVPDGSNLVIDVMAQAIQAEPTDVVREAWGFVPGGSRN